MVNTILMIHHCCAGLTLPQYGCLEHHSYSTPETSSVPLWKFCLGFCTLSICRVSRLSDVSFSMASNEIKDKLLQEKGKLLDMLKQDFDNPEIFFEYSNIMAAVYQYTENINAQASSLDDDFVQSENDFIAQTKQDLFAIKMKRQTKIQTPNAITQQLNELHGTFL